jgi:hypothetical protein
MLAATLQALAKTDASPWLRTRFGRHITSCRLTAATWSGRAAGRGDARPAKNSNRKTKPSGMITPYGPKVARSGPTTGMASKMDDGDTERSSSEPP